MTYLYTHLKVHGAYLWYDSIDVHFLQDFLSELSGEDSRWCSDNTRQSWEKSIGLWELNAESSADVQHQRFLVKQVPLSSTLHARSPFPALPDCKRTGGIPHLNGLPTWPAVSPWPQVNFYSIARKVRMPFPLVVEFHGPAQNNVLLVCLLSLQYSQQLHINRPLACFIL